MSDPEHTALYAAELAAFDGTDLEEVRPFADVAALVEVVVGGSWWPGSAVDVRRARSDAGSSSARCSARLDGRLTFTIRLADPQVTVATAAHELAHVLAGQARGHDAVFRRAYLDVVRVITNVDSTDRRHDLHVHQLVDALAVAGLDVGERSWPTPPASVGGAFAL